MKHSAGLDIPVKETSVCIDEAGKVCRKVKVSSHSQDLSQTLKDPAWQVGPRRARSQSTVAMAVQRAGGGGSAGRPYRDPVRRPSSRRRTTIAIAMMRPASPKSCTSTFSAPCM
jgi:hypothetical protein